MTELVGPWVWDQIFAQRAGDPTQSPFGLIWHDQGTTSPRHKRYLQTYVQNAYLTHCMYPYVSQCLCLTCLLETFFTVTTWLPRILQPGRDVVAHGRPYKTESRWKYPTICASCKQVVQYEQVGSSEDGNQGRFLAKVSITSFP